MAEEEVGLGQGACTPTATAAATAAAAVEAAAGAVSAVTAAQKRNGAASRAFQEQALANPGQALLAASSLPGVRALAPCAATSAAGGVAAAATDTIGV